MLAILAAIYPERRGKLLTTDNPRTVIGGMIEEAEQVARVWAEMR